MTNRARGFSQAVRAIEKSLSARVGVSILDTGSARRWEHRADERFPMCSTFKVVAAAAVLAKVEAGTEDLAHRIAFTADDLVSYSPVTETQAGGGGMTLAELCKAAITQSDNTAANLVLRTIGGPSAVTAFARSRHDRVTRLDRWEPDLNDAIPGDPRDTTAPGSMTELMSALLVKNGLKPKSQVQLIAWLEANTTGDARLRAGLPKDWRIGDKTGTCGHGTANDIAVIWPNAPKPWIASVFITETEASVSDRNDAIAGIGRELTKLIKS